MVSADHHRHHQSSYLLLAMIDNITENNVIQTKIMPLLPCSCPVVITD
jgi:hypothetical protein